MVDTEEKAKSPQTEHKQTINDKYFGGLANFTVATSILGTSLGMGIAAVTDGSLVERSNNVIPIEEKKNTLGATKKSQVEKPQVEKPQVKPKKSPYPYIAWGAGGALLGASVIPGAVWAEKRRKEKAEKIKAKAATSRLI